MHAAATWFMIGLIWVIQTVHYPLFALVGEPGFAGYEAAHTRRMGAVLAVPALTEVVTASLLFLTPPSGLSRALALTSGMLLAAIWLLTAGLQVRQHRALGTGFDPHVHRELVTGNWWRTALWSGRGVLAAVMLT